MMRLQTNETIKMNITMKKINILASLLLGGLLFSACDSDRDDNPTLVMPTGFEFTLLLTRKTTPSICSTRARWTSRLISPTLVASP